MKSYSFFKLLAFHWIIGGLFLVNAFAQQKARLAVLNFDSRQVGMEIQRACKCSFSAAFDYGDRATDALTNRLINGSSYQVVDRKMLDSIFKEQQLYLGGHIDEQTAVQVGKFAQAGIIVYGKIYPKVVAQNYAYGLGKVEVSVQLELRMVSVKSAIIFANFNAQSEIVKSKFVTVDIIQQALLRAIDETIVKLAADVEKKADSPEVKDTINTTSPGAELRVCGMVVRVKETELTINKELDVFRSGQILRVRRRDGVITHPDNPNKILGYDYTEVGSVSITEIQGNLVKGAFSGNKPAAMKDEIFCPVGSSVPPNTPIFPAPPARPNQHPDSKGRPVAQNIPAPAAMSPSPQSSTAGVMTSPPFSNVRVAPPSSKLRPYRHQSGTYEIGIPDNWQVATGNPNSLNVTFYPTGGASQEGIVYGVLVDSFQATTASSLEAATKSIVESTIKTNPYLTVQSPPARNGKIAGREVMTVTLMGTSPLIGKGETVLLWTLPLNNGRFLYLIQVTPSADTIAYASTFARMMQSLKIHS